MPIMFQTMNVKKKEKGEEQKLGKSPTLRVRKGVSKQEELEILKNIDNLYKCYL